MGIFGALFGGGASSSAGSSTGVTEEQAIEAISQRWVDVWPGLQPDVPYTLDNEEFDNAPAFARVSVVHSVAQQASMGPSGTRMFERRGVISVQLFTEANTGRQPLARLADSARRVFEGQRLSAAGSPVYVYAGSTRGEAADGAWFSAVVVFEFCYRSMV